MTVPPPSFDRPPKLTVPQYYFVAFAALGALVTSLFLIASLSGPRRMLDDGTLDRLVDEHRNAPGEARSSFVPPPQRSAQRELAAIAEAERPVRSSQPQAAGLRSAPDAGERSEDRQVGENSAGLATDAERSPPAEPVGTLSILVRPWGALYVNGELHRSNTDVVYTVELTLGEHAVRVVHPTLGAEQQTLHVDPASPRRVVFDLDRRKR